jgi:midasin
MRVFSETFGYEAYQQDLAAVTVRFAKTHLQIGQSFLKYPQAHSLESTASRLDPGTYAFTDMQLRHLESLIKCLEMNWMVILVGSSCVGKTSLIRMVADLMNQSLVEFPVNNATDTSDLLGGFNKIEHEKLVLNEVIDLLKQLYQNLIKSFLGISDR